ncbi:MAG: SPASM domain-containing protein [Gloeomargaritaceae cyanobacterium C42_A2020_066]|nr:SPASM domain-containing protein [Gloeomargaritaceae cyanobacterium C42_A2020_066]
MASLYPESLRLEASSRCQLACPACPTASGAIQPTIGSGVLKLADFQALVDSSPWVKKIELSNYGEIFLNPDLLEILAYAYAKGIQLSAHNGANLNHVKSEVLEGLVKYQLHSITCSIDGASQATYEQYRVKGDFERVIGNIQKINHFKALYQSSYPILDWQFVVFGHNQHEIPAARQMATDLGMNFRLKLSWDGDFSPVVDRDGLRQEVGVADREEYREKHGRDYMQTICHQLWDKPQINWDGKVLGCCRNFWGEFGGNAFRDGLAMAINSERMTYARQMLGGQQPPRDDIPCTTCSIYQTCRRRASGWKGPLSPVNTLDSINGYAMPCAG